MRKFFTIFLITISHFVSYGQTFDLGTEIQGAVAAGTSGCGAGCSAFCTVGGSGNSIATVSQLVTVPPGNFLSLVITTNNCAPSTSGLDSGDNIFVNGIQVVTGNANLIVNYSGCFSNNGAVSLNVPIALTANRRDETIHVVATVSPTNPGGCTLLPIVLSKFDLYLKGLTISGTFSTASETNNSHFNIERSADARNFESIGEIKGAGNSSKEISYEFIDERPLPGINYYRIKQTDFDGQFSYSEIRSVRHKGISNVSVTPRTTEGRLDITTELEDYTIAIYNAAGQEVKRMIDMSLDQSISVETMQAGVYFVKIFSRTESEMVRIVKI